jgi:ABC-type nitrate/sulfonate/bicarbonate transport system substrate-binding protein
MLQERVRFRFAGGAQGFNWLPVFVAEDLGIFRKFGLDVEYRKMNGVAQATQAVQEGEAELAITPPEGAVTDFLRGGALRIVAANAVRLPMSLVARPGITSVAGLRGKKIGTSSLTEGTAIYTQIMLAEQGLQFPGDYDFALAGIHTKRWEALQWGEIDAAPQPAPWNFLAERQGYNLLGEVHAAIPEILFTALIGNHDWLQANRALVGRLLAALVEAHQITNDPARQEEILPIFQRITTSDDADLARRGLVYMRDMGMWPEGLAISDRALATTVDLMIRAGLLDEATRDRAAGVFDRSYLQSLPA